MTRRIPIQMLEIAFHRFRFAKRIETIPHPRRGIAVLIHPEFSLLGT